ncbi:MAG: hypothetical protein AAGA18_16165 [Verrucomicrobiota bacterium]
MELTIYLNTRLAMQIFKKIVYLIVALSLLPVIATYFAYGSPIELLYMVVTIGALASLIYMITKPSTSVAKWALVLNFAVLVIHLLNLKFYWFADEGGDPRVRITFTIQWILIALTVFNLFRDSRLLKSS